PPADPGYQYGTRVPAPPAVVVNAHNRPATHFCHSRPGHSATASAPVAAAPPATPDGSARSVALPASGSQTVTTQSVPQSRQRAALLQQFRRSSGCPAGLL